MWNSWKLTCLSTARNAFQLWPGRKRRGSSASRSWFFLFLALIDQTLSHNVYCIFCGHVCGFEFSCSPKPQCYNSRSAMQTTNSKCNSHPKTFNVRYEDDTEKANDKKAAQLRNKVKRNCAGAQMIMLAFYGLRSGRDNITFCRSVVGWDDSRAFRMVTSPSMRRTGEAWWTLVWEFLLVNPVSSRPKTVPEEMKLGEDECGVELEQLAGESLTSSSQVCLFHLTNQSPDSWSFSAMCCVAFSSFDIHRTLSPDRSSGRKWRSSAGSPRWAGRPPPTSPSPSSASSCRGGGRSTRPSWTRPSQGWRGSTLSGSRWWTQSTGWSRTSVRTTTLSSSTSGQLSWAKLATGEKTISRLFVSCSDNHWLVARWVSEFCVGSINKSESVAGLAGSIASVFSKHIITACRTFRLLPPPICIVIIVVMIDIIRETKFVVSMPIPRNTELCAGPEDCLTIYDSLRRSQKGNKSGWFWQQYIRQVVHKQPPRKLHRLRQRDHLLKWQPRNG